MKRSSAKSKGRIFEAEIKANFDWAYNFGKYDLRLPCASSSGVDIVINSELAEEVMLYAPEVKRAENSAITIWWDQCIKNAEIEEKEPVLFWRQSNRKAVAIITEEHWNSFDIDQTGNYNIISTLKNFHDPKKPKGFEPIKFLHNARIPKIVMIRASKFFDLIDRL